MFNRLVNSILILLVLLNISAKADVSNSRTLTDMSGRQVSIPQSVDSIACIGRSALRLVCYMHAADFVCGVEFPEKKQAPDVRPYLLAYPFLRELPYIGHGDKGDPELLIKIAPQVIIYADGSPAAIESMQAKTGIPVINIHPGDLGENIQDFYSSLQLLGSVFNNPDRSESLITFIKKQLNDITFIADENNFDSVSVYVGGLIFKGKHGIQSTQSTYVPFQLLGLHNAANEIKLGRNHPVQVNIEQLMLWQPSAYYIDMACQDQVRADLRQYPFLLQGQPVYTLYPNRQYGENYENTLINTLYIAHTLGVLDVEKFMSLAQNIYSCFYNATTWQDFTDLYGFPSKMTFD